MQKSVLLLIKLLLSLPLLTTVIHAQESLNMTLLSNLDYGNDLSDIWGYATADGEYALVGVYDGISVVDVSNPSLPTELEFFPGPGSIWRDLKTWGDYLYCINETGGGLQIVNLAEVINGDLSPTYIQNTSLGFTTAHNIFIDENGVLYVFGSNYGVGGAAMYDLVSDPENPTFLGIFDDYYFHDGMVRGDTLWGGAIYNGVFSVVDVSDKANPVIIGSHSTPSSFTHNCWISDDGNTVFTTDEVSGAYVTAYDVSDLNNIEELDRIQAWSDDSDVILHNTHVAGDFLVTSYYTDGVSVVDASNPSNLIEVGYYDTSTGYSGNGFNGAWGTYPFLPSGNILVSDIENGLYVIEPKYGNASFIEGYVTNSVTGAPINNVTVQIVGSNNHSLTALNGFYETGMANEGTYQISFSAPGYEDLIQSVTIASGEVLSLDVQIEFIFLEGCTDVLYTEYSALANTDDGSCTTIVIEGCMDSLYVEYSSIANTNNESCSTLVEAGCTYVNADNYNADANTDDGSCELIACPYPDFFEYNSNYTDGDVSMCLTLIVEGCTNIYATNYNSEANLDDGSCNLIGCMEEQADNYNAEATINDSSLCIYYGCTNNSAENYDELANINDGTCIIYGCVLSVFPNYNPEATYDDGSCNFGSADVYGCTDQGSLNYNSQATIDNGACEYIFTPQECEEGFSIILLDGWNLIGYSCVNTINAETAFAPLIDILIIAKDNAGNAYLPEWNFNGIGDLLGGYGYQLKITEQVNNFNVCEL
jgi:choice-of-anchor B domain-containing protein